MPTHFGVPRNVHKSHKSSDIISSIIYSVAKALPHLARHVFPRVYTVPGALLTCINAMCEYVSVDDATCDPIINHI